MATTGKGTKLYYGDSEGSETTPIAHLTNVNIPEISVGNVDATEYESSDNATAKVSTGWQEVGDITFDLNYEDTETSALYALVDVPKYWKIEKNNGAFYSCYGWLSKLGGVTPNKDIQKQSGAITVSGLITYTPAGS